jgi:tetratricopeptide (TPR) repeat protein
MSRMLLLVPAIAAVSMLLPGRASAEPKYPHLHHALYEMKEAHKQLKEAGHDFGGHRERALEGLDAAIRQTEKALEAIGDPYHGYTPREGTYHEYKNFVHLRHSVVEMKEARRELKEAPHDYKGHRDEAIRFLDYAIEQVDKCLPFCK